MALSFDEIWVYGGQLIVAEPFTTPKALGTGLDKVDWSSFIQGPLQVGAVDTFSSATATTMIGRTDTITTPLALNTRGNVTIEGDGGTANGLWVTGGASVDSLYVQGDVYVTGKVDCGNKGRLASRFSSADARPKPFDMEHPSKGDGYRLRYACIEGPEVGVYCRGRVKNEKVIRLPAYWKDLVRVDSITVQLQPIGAHQDIIIKRWDEEYVYLQAQGGLPINCFYHVYGERKDVNPLVVEYEGDSWEDYPDPDYNDPQFTKNVNTRTI